MRISVMLDAVSGAPAHLHLRLLAAVFALALAGCGDADAVESAAPGTRGADPPSSPSEARATRARPEGGMAWVIFGDEAEADTIFAEVAQTEEERSRGLMYREALAENAGMLFVFPDLRVRSFWMQNTFIPLDIAFMDANFRIFDTHPLEPESTEFVESAGPAHYALEVNRGWFAAHGVGVGAAPRIVFGI